MVSTVRNSSKVSQFFERWTPAQAYVLGFFAADGCMYHSRNGGYYNGGFYIEFTSTDLEAIQNVKMLFGIDNKIETARLWRAETSVNKKERYKLRIVNKAAYTALMSQGFTPAKSLTLSFPDIPETFLKDFIRGYFDGDGCVYFKIIQRRNRSPLPFLNVRFTCGSRSFLLTLQKLLHQFAGTNGGSIHPHTSVWDLSYSTKDSQKIYAFMYQDPDCVALTRKREVFKKALTVLKA